MFDISHRLAVLVQLDGDRIAAVLEIDLAGIGSRDEVTAVDRCRVLVRSDDRHANKATKNGTHRCRCRCRIRGQSDGEHGAGHAGDDGCSEERCRVHCD